jgi:hypothetical protein
LAEVDDTAVLLASAVPVLAIAAERQLTLMMA